MRTIVLALTIAVLQLVFVAGAGAVTFGDDLLTQPAANSGDNTYVPAFNFDGSEFTGAPVAGVLTSIRLRSTGNATTETVSVQRRMGAWDAGYASYKKISEALPVTVTADATSAGHVTEVLTRVPVAIGDVLGLDHTVYDTYDFHLFSGGPSMCGYRATAPAQATGAEANFGSIGCNPWHPMLQGTIEPDADGDLFGDETQDLCPTDATRQTACAAAPNPPLPANLMVTSVKSKASAGSAATRSFTVKNIGASAATPVTFALSSSKKVRKFTFVKGCKVARGGRSCTIDTLGVGASITIKVKVTPKASTSTKLTATVSTPGETATTDNSATTSVKFKLTK